MKTLYVTDLDGTLLRSDETLSQFSCDAIYSLMQKGMLFSYATARSLSTSGKVTKGLDAQMPLIVHNGAFIVNGATKEKIVKNQFSDSDAKEIYDILKKHDICPIVYSIIDDRERFSYNAQVVGRALGEFIASRKGDGRDNPLTGDDRILIGAVDYFACIDDEDKLHPAYCRLRENYNCIYQKDVYSGEQWLEILPQKATKANAVIQLKELYGCDRVVCFGDGINDMPMFSICDECYAVANAVDELKKMATGTIGSNEEDAVARWLLKNSGF